MTQFVITMTQWGKFYIYVSYPTTCNYQIDTELLPIQDKRLRYILLFTMLYICFRFEHNNTVRNQNQEVILRIIKLKFSTKV